MTSLAAPEFPPVDPEAWRERARRELKGKDPHALDRTLFGGAYGGLIQRVVETTRPEQMVAARRSQPGWKALAFGLDRAAPDSVRAAWSEASAWGAEGAWVELEAQLASGRSSRGEGAGLGLAGLRALSENGVAADLWAGAVAPQIQASVPGFSGRVLADPVGAALRSGVFFGRLEEQLSLAASTEGVTPCVDGLTLSEAGADAVTELAWALSGVAAWRAAGAKGRIVLRVSLGEELFVELAKLRALRSLLLGLDRRGGLAASARIEICGQVGRRSWGADEPETNLLRATVSALAGSLGGVDAMVIPAFDAPDQAQPGSASARRISFNLHHLLARESHLGSVEDPAAGSYSIEQLSLQLAEAALRRAQELEGEGGLEEALVDGRWAKVIAAQADEAARAVAHGTRKLVAVNVYPAPQRAERGAAEKGGSGDPGDTGWVLEGEISQAPALEARRWATPFEALREEGEVRKLRISALCLGPLKEHRGRRAELENLLRCAGVELRWQDESADGADPTLILCGAARAYSEDLPELLPRLRSKGWKTLVCFEPGDTGSPPGVERSLSTSGDLLLLGAELQALASEEAGQ